MAQVYGKRINALVSFSLDQTGRLRPGATLKTK